MYIKLFSCVQSWIFLFISPLAFIVFPLYISLQFKTRRFREHRKLFLSFKCAFCLDLFLRNKMLGYVLALVCFSVSSTAYTLKDTYDASNYQNMFTVYTVRSHPTSPLKFQTNKTTRAQTTTTST